MSSGSQYVSRRVKWNIIPRSDLFFRKRGALGTLDFKIEYFIRLNSNNPSNWQRISPWHHISIIESPVIANDNTLLTVTEEISSSSRDGITTSNCHQVISPSRDSLSGLRKHLDLSMLSMPNVFINMVVEIPKFANEKMEIATSKEGNPVMQDTKDGKPRMCSNPMYWNYGAIPQTWENPTIKGGLQVEYSLGDNDPLDIIEVGETPLQLGAVVPVKVLGALAMIDQGELDWKVLAIRASDERSKVMIRDTTDIEELFPKVMSGIREWLRWYKTVDNKPLNTFGYNEEWLSLSDTYNVLMEGYTQWLSLITCKPDIKDLWIPHTVKD